MFSRLLLGIFLPILLLFALATNAQDCYREGNFTDGPDYPVKGKATLVKSPGKNLVLKFSSDFSTETGPDLDVYLANTPKPDANSKNIHSLKNIAGAQEYEIPADIELEAYKYVIIHCTEFSHFWGNAILGDKMGNCTTTSINKQTSESSKNKVYITDKNNLYFQFSKNAFKAFKQVRIMDLAGSELAKINLKTNQFNYQLNRTNIPSGIYLVNLSGNGLSHVEKVFFP